MKTKKIMIILHAIVFFLAITDMISTDVRCYKFIYFLSNFGYKKCTIMSVTVIVSIVLLIIDEICLVISLIGNLRALFCHKRIRGIEIPYRIIMFLVSISSFIMLMFNYVAYIT